MAICRDETSVWCSPLDSGNECCKERKVCENAIFCRRDEQTVNMKLGDEQCRDEMEGVARAISSRTVSSDFLSVASIQFVCFTLTNIECPLRL
jgi:hypothetical protein